VIATQPVHWSTSRYLATAVVSLFVSWSFPSNGSIRHSRNKTHKLRVCHIEHASVQGNELLFVGRSVELYSIRKQYQGFNLSDGKSRSV
jgi:hypothetical protein